MGSLAECRGVKLEIPIKMRKSMLLSSARAYCVLSENAFPHELFLFVVWMGWAGSSLLHRHSLCNEHMSNDRGLLFVVVHGLLTAVASLVVEHRFRAGRLQ